jgi:hypothetical protein
MIERNNPAEADANVADGKQRLRLRGWRGIVGICDRRR